MSQAILTSSHHPRETISRFPVFVFWIALQIIALVVARCDVQLTANPAHLTRQWSAEILLLAQIGVSSLLFYDLLGSLRASVLAFALAFPLTQISAAGEGWAASLRCSIILLLWLAGLAAWRAALPMPRLLTAALSFWTWGSVILWYLVAEVSISAPLTRVLSYSSPLLVALRRDEAFAFCFFAIFAGAGLIALGISRRACRRPDALHVRP